MTRTPRKAGADDSKGAKRKARTVTIVRPPQPVPLPKWQLVDDPERYEYNWGGRREVERLAVTESTKGPQYSYIHPVGTDGKLDHWVPSNAITPIPHSEVGVQTPSWGKHAVRRVDHIVFGDMRIPVWYPSSFPQALNDELLANGGRLYMCDVCLKYTTDAGQMIKHRGNARCEGEGPLKGLSSPPGCEIYSYDNWSIWDVDGGDSDSRDGEELLTWERSSIVSSPLPQPPGSVAALEPQYRARYTLSLCLLARMFLDTKLIRFGTNPFRFFVLTEEVKSKHLFRGMFSREKGHYCNNLSCIMVLPPWQRSGWGKRLVHASYLLSRIEGTVGKPEKPLSVIGNRVYSSYQRDQVLDFVRVRPQWRDRENSKLLAEISSATSIDRGDVEQVLRSLANGTDRVNWDAVLAAFPAVSRPELQLCESSLCHLSYAELAGQPPTDI